MSKFVRANIHAMKGYVPGEQPRDGEFIKLNTNENPYPPSPRVLEAIQTVLTGDRLRKYPDPLGTEFRQTVGRVLGTGPLPILIGNGSDDILTILTRAFVPEGGLITSPSPSYLLYRTLADIQGARFETVPFDADWKLPRTWPFPDAHLTFIPNPNSPSGTLVDLDTLASIARSLSGVLVIDEAYVDFAENNALALLKLENVVLTRTLSKSYSLAGIRFGFGIGDPVLIRSLNLVKDSYNCDVLSLAAATAAVNDQAYLEQTKQKILATRSRMERELAKLGFTVCPSSANFVWCRHSTHPVQPIYEELKRRNILVRYMPYDGYGDGLRISVGTDAEIDQLLQAISELV